MVLKSAIRLYTAKRIPLIRFRAGLQDDQSTHAAASASIDPAAMKKSLQSVKVLFNLPIIGFDNLNTPAV